MIVLFTRDLASGFTLHYCKASLRRILTVYMYKIGSGMSVAHARVSKVQELEVTRHESFGQEIYHRGKWYLQAV